jgi:hypothetical protein
MLKLGSIAFPLLPRFDGRWGARIEVASVETMSNAMPAASSADEEPRVGQFVALVLSWRWPHHERIPVARPSRARDAPGPSVGRPGEHSAPAALQAVGLPGLSLAIREALLAWRVAERELGEISPASPSWASVDARRANFRDSYHRLFNEYRDRESGS